MLVEWSCVLYARIWLRRRRVTSGTRRRWTRAWCNYRQTRSTPVKPMWLRSSSARRDAVRHSTSRLYATHLWYEARRFTFFMSVIILDVRPSVCLSALFHATCAT